MNYKELNLRVLPTYSFHDFYGTGDSHKITKYNVIRDFSKGELNRNVNIKYSDSVIEKGIIIETFNSAVNANIFLNALIEINPQ